ncbi:4'-phosphopantetheinyl transferase family protein [Actinoplanes derwentensis]|uniref:4'-phosphopantetheinyl transferase EntD (Siderophore biosynthesis) n=1 Tax=Actinoplanes derwentensis TaxID=113562 RepID=A0A1H2D6Y1_9ACTN|nr:4'-phosphopantetheinyl transferase superfamily protein [Actinoplanes derwentensis]GID89445.1 4'-phosphopantetheinyl transferase [Actinoplanes derwentensis]SDT78500.1 4'-phosphopantetheinyl transferase EntD (siderophore biosynthesis) [Actinoplanes derwentensis]
MLLRSLLPSSVTTAEAYSDDPAEAAFPGEQDLIAAASEGRRREFVTSRRCAREALAALGEPAVPIRPGPRREPVWPTGVAGSITHCTGYRAAAVVRTSDVIGLGIDAEPHAPLPPRVLGAVTAPGDVEHLAALAAGDPSVHWDRLLFSAKESVYKVWYPLTGRWLGFGDAALEIDPRARTFTAHLLVDAPFRTLTGRFLVERGLVVTAVAHHE